MASEREAIPGGSGAHLKEEATGRFRSTPNTASGTALRQDPGIGLLEVQKSDPPRRRTRPRALTHGLAGAGSLGYFRTATVSVRVLSFLFGSRGEDTTVAVAATLAGAFLATVTLMTTGLNWLAPGCM